MISYLLTKEQFTFLSLAIVGNKPMPLRFLKFVLRNRIQSVIDDLYKAGYVVRKEPLTVDRVIAFLITKISESNKFMESKSGKYFVCYPKELIIVLSDDNANKDGMKIIPLENEDALDEFLKENCDNPGKYSLPDDNIENEEIS